MDISQEKLDGLSAEVQDAVLSGDVVYARELIAQLRQSGISPEQVGSGAALYRRLMFVRLAQLNEEECLWLFENFILEGLSIPDFDLLQALDNRFTMLLETEEQMAFLEKVQKVVDRSQALLGDKPLVIDQKEVSPSVAHWLKEYLYTPAQGQYRQSIDELEYVNRGKFAAQLTPEQRAVLLQLLRFYDTLRNSVLEYQQAPVAYVEDFPGVNYDLVQVKPDDFDSPEHAAAVFKLLEQQVSSIATPPPTKPAAGAPNTGRFAAASAFPQRAETNSGPRPNIQGVLSNAPIKKENIQVEQSLPVSQTPAKVAQAQSQLRPFQTPPAKPVIPAVPVQSAMPKFQPSPTISPESVPSKGVALPAKVPDNLPMVEPEDLPAVMPIKVSRQPFVKPVTPAPKVQAPSLPPTLNMDKIQAEVARKKGVAQEDIDQRLASLKKRSVNKN